MLKNFLRSCAVILLMATTTAAFAQTVHWSEDFANGIPATWSMFDVDGLTTNSQMQGFSLRGCTDGAFGDFQGWIGYCGQVMSSSWYTPAGQSDEWLVSEAVAVPTGQPNVFVRWRVLAYDGSAPDDYAIRISSTPAATAADLPGFAANTIFSDTDPVAGEWVTKVAEVPASFYGQNIYIAIHNFANDEFLIAVDDLELVTLPARDLEATEFLTRGYSVANTPTNIIADFFNLGGETVTSVDVEYEVGTNAPVTATISGLNIEPYESSIITHTTPWTSTVGAKNIRYRVTSINGMSDVNPANDEVIRAFTATTAPSPRNLLNETFTSSTCPPCLPGNQNLETVQAQFNASNAGRLVSVRHQQNFPGVGDPYATDELVNRRAYYNQNSVPHSVIDGYRTRVNTNSLNLGNFNAALARPAFGTFAGSFLVDEPAQTITINGTFTPSTDLTGEEVLQVVIAEKRTTFNAATNGETEFFDVVRKFLPNENGAPTGAVAAGTPFAINVTYTFNGNYRRPPSSSDPANRTNHAIEHSIEDFQNLEVFAWVENPEQQEVLNAGAMMRAFGVNVDNELTAGSFQVNPNPVSGNTANVALDIREAAQGTIEVIDVNGKVVMSQALGQLAVGTRNVSLNVADLTAGTYHVTLNLEGKGITTRPMMVVR